MQIYANIGLSWVDHWSRDFTRWCTTCLEVNDPCEHVSFQVSAPLGGSCSTEKVGLSLKVPLLLLYPMNTCAPLGGSCATEPGRTSV